MSEKQQERSEESLRHEYTEVALNARHYSNLRFAVYTILFAVEGRVETPLLFSHAALALRGYCRAARFLME